MMTPLLRTKLHVPTPNADAVVRPRLIEKLASGHQHDGAVAVVTAPAGYGKTTLLSGWHAAHPALPVAWLTLDDADNDPFRFWSYTAVALETLAPLIPKGTLSELAVEQLPVETILTHFINEMTAVPEAFTLVLDDFHVITQPELLEWLAFLIRHQPPRMRLIVSSRSVPPLPLARTRAQGRLTEFTAKDLRFTQAETAAFMRQTMNLQLTEKDVDVLAARTEGWVAGLQLVGLSLQRTEATSDTIEALDGTYQYIADYFVEEVLGLLPPDVLAFLMETAFLDIFTAPLCDALTGRDDSAEIIARLEANHLFIVRQDDDRQWYRYHSLFADLLRARQKARCTEAEIAALHHRVSDWCLDHGLIEKAINHILLARDYDRALELLKRYGYILVSRGRALTVDCWIDRFPPSSRRTYPDLALIKAWACLARSQFGEVEGYLRQVERHLDRGWLAETSEIRRDVRGQLQAIRATVALNLGNADAAVPLSHQALDTLKPDNTEVRSVVTLDLADASLDRDEIPEATRLYRDALRTARPTGNAIISINAMSKLAHLQFIQGNLYAAADVYHESLQTLDRWGWKNQATTGLITSGMALLLYEWNTLNQARTYAQTALDQLKRWGHTFHIIETQILLAAIETVHGEVGRAEAYLDDASRWSKRHRERHMERWVLEARARIALNRGDRSEALRTYERIARRFPDAETEGSLTRLHAVRPLILNGDHARAEAILDAWQAYTTRRGLTTQRIETKMLRAINAHAQGQLDTALATLQDALVLAEPGGFIRTFIDEGPTARDLLRMASSRGIAPKDYVARLVDASAADRSVPIEPLSTREDDVLRLIADQLSNREIAETLYISVNTVKTHVRRLYDKLGASSRLEAVMRAQELGLL